MAHAQSTWQPAFVATVVALGGTVDDALSALDPALASPEVDALAAGLRAPQRPRRAAALAEAVHDVMQAIESARLR